SAEGYKGEKTGKMTAIRQGKSTRKKASTACRQAFRIEVWLLFSTKLYGGVGLWLRVHRQRAVGIAGIARHRRHRAESERQTYRGSTRMNADQEIG
ncbi:MAG TPA: hypothetical protein VGJ51_05130, partial [Candidatus Angelobacter sp.]